ncbi:uncharacterized protein EAF02_001434 [Botrytis sinoallii]|uniref:uncharacterized protein n=1 Tax=Botrytis sinoallii TaxID=1463999 RepID=UPI0019015C1A|nr:uncharacterized protein EAF02_001434 [Botrytis sinoallii]KAF7891109.1 hypothetical protein EAF02_001434 [Botrytis sinoallii]
MVINYPVNTLSDVYGNAMMKTNSIDIDGDSPSGYDNGDMIHPILGNYHLPVEIENSRKQSGMHNLSREGWGEEKCRNYLIRLCSDVPRNFPYKDGLRILHPRLQERFGDENVDLALGVLEELIEIEEPPPFPASVFQRWKHEHLRRKANFTNPHAPHTATIQAPVVPTQALVAYREEQARRKFAQPQISPTAIPYCESCNSNIAHQPSWKIDHSVFVSVGGKPATLAYCPTPEELHKGMWDPEYGRAGVCVRPNTAQTSPPGSAMEPIGPNATPSKYSTPTRSFMNNAKRELGQRVMSALSETRESLSNVASDRVELLDIERCEKFPRDRISTSSETSRKISGQSEVRKVSKIMNVNLPPGREIPNANFARKNELILSGPSSLDYLLTSRQPTLDEVVNKMLESKTNCPGKATSNIDIHAPLSGEDANPLRSYLSTYYSLPASPSDFFDGGLDYKWDTPDPIESAENEVSNTYSVSGADEALPSTHLTYGDSHNITDDSQVENAYHAHTTDCVDEIKASKFSILDSYDTKLLETKEQEMLYPTVYVPPPKSDILKMRGPAVTSKNAVPKESSVPSSEPFEDEHGHENRNSCDGTCQSWECRYKQEYRKSSGNLVKWKEPSSEYDEESEESEDSRLSPDIYSPPSSLDPLNKYKGFPHSTEQLSRKASNISSNSELDYFESYNTETATAQNMTFPKVENFEPIVPELSKSQLSTSLGKVDITPPGRLSERSYLAKIRVPIRSKSSAAFGTQKAGSPTSSIPLTTEFPLTSQSQTKTNQINLANKRLNNSYSLESLVESTSSVVAFESVQKQVMNFDGAADDCLPKQNNRSKVATRDNRSKNNDGDSLYNENNISDAAKRFLMELNQGRLPTLQSPIICPPQPLYICKQPSQVQLKQATEHQDNNYNHEQTRYPPRSSSIPKRECLGSIEQAMPFLVDEDIATREPNNRSTKDSQMSRDQPRTPETTARSTVSEIKQYYFSDTSGTFGTSSGLFGNFIPIGTPGSVYSPQPQQPLYTMPIHSFSHGRKAGNFRNPYIFEPDTPLVMDESRQTTMTDFMHIDANVRPASSPSLGHVKNSRHGHGHGLQRSDTSPSITPLRFAAREESPAPDHRAYDASIDSISPILQNGFATQSLPNRGRAATLELSRLPVNKGARDKFLQPSSSPVHQAARNYQRPSRSPVRMPSGEHRKQSSRPSDEDVPDGRGRSATYSPVRKEVKSSESNVSYSSTASTTINHQMTRSPTKNLVDVAEKEEPDFLGQDLLPISPKKRSRSPMKKMFGEHGWLGSSQNEVRPSVMCSKSTQKVDRPKKPGMMEKIKNKIEGFAEKADMRLDKNRISVLSISINPYEQARYLVELELMVVHTANTFLMIQFSQGRMSIDSIKKTVDTWKNKGRPAVVEFMYDQGTQRDLVTANQYNFRFHGNRLGDDVRISSMLYNWKQVASLMSIRTFCNADTVLLKLVFDVEQILELIGGSEQIMFRLQHLRLSINEAIRVAKVERSTSRNGREKGWEPQLSSNISHSDPYEGRKLVPEHYAN